MDNKEKDLPGIMSSVLEQQDNTCANCGIDFSEDAVPKFHYLIPPSQGGQIAVENVEAVCARCFGDAGSEGI